MTVHQQEHRCDDGAADRRWRVRGDEPVRHLDVRRGAGDGLVGVEVRLRDDAAVRGHVLDEGPRDLPREQRGGALGGDPLEEIRQVRLTRAKQLLETTDLPISSVARLLAMNDGCYLNNFFRRWTGMTPLAFRLPRSGFKKRAIPTT